MLVRKDGLGDYDLKSCLSSSGCKSRPTRVEPDRSEASLATVLVKGVGDAQVREQVGRGGPAPKEGMFRLPSGSRFREGRTDTAARQGEADVRTGAVSERGT